MIFDQAKRLISLGMRATRMNNKQTKEEVRRLVKAGLVEAKHAARLAVMVAKEANKERKIMTAFVMKEYATEMKKAAPHARIAAERGRRLVKKAVRTAKKIQSAVAKTGRKANKSTKAARRTARRTARRAKTSYQAKRKIRRR